MVRLPTARFRDLLRAVLLVPDVIRARKSLSVKMAQRNIFCWYFLFEYVFPYSVWNMVHLISLFQLRLLVWGLGKSIVENGSWGWSSISKNELLLLLCHYLNSMYSSLVYILNGLIIISFHSLEDLRDMEYRKVILKGKFLHDKELYIGPRSLISDGSGASSDSGPKASGILSSGLMSSSQSGYFVITPFKLADSK